LAILVCGCVGFKQIGFEKTPTTVVTVESKLATTFDEKIRKSLQEVFGDVKLVDVMENEDQVHLTYKISKEITKNEFERFIGSLGYDVVEWIVEGEDVVLKVSLGGKEFEVHVTSIGDLIDIDIGTFK